VLFLGVFTAQANFPLKKILKKLPQTPQKKQQKQQADATPSGRSVSEFSIAFSYTFSRKLTCVLGAIHSCLYLWCVGVSLHGSRDGYCYDNVSTGPSHCCFVCSDSGKCESIPDSVVPFALKMMRLYQESKVGVENAVVSSLRNSFKFFSNVNLRS
jgi:hypothetical protein